MPERDRELVSIVIPAYNAQRTLARCLEASLDQTYAPTELIVVDDGSTDDTATIAQLFPDVRCIRQENRGPAAARNAGAYEARGKWIAFTDSDCIPEREWIERLVARLEEGVTAVGGTYGIANAGNSLARIIQAEIEMRHERFGTDVDVLGSFNMMVQKTAFEEAGGFDVHFRHASGEDNDLAYRLADAGGMLRFAPDARVLHYHPERLWPYLKTQKRHGFWRVKLYRKHLNRAGKGDYYAGRADLWSPAMALLFLGAPIPVVAAGLRGAWTSLPSVLLLFVWMEIGLEYAALRIGLIMRIRARLRRQGVAAHGLDDIFFLRDVARGIGMLQGIDWFLLRRKETV